MRSTFISAVLAVSLSLAPTLTAQNSPISPSLTPATEGVLEEGINIPEGTLDSALGLIEILTGRTVLRANSLPQTPFPLVVNQTVTHTEALMAIETTLALNGIAVAPLGERFVKVVPIGAVRIESPELIEGSTLNLPPSGRIATKLFVFEFVQVGTFGGKIASLLNPQIGGGAMPFEQANAMLITDSVSTLQRIELLVNELDKPNVASLDPKFYPLVYAKASDLANKMRTILQGPAAQQLGTATTFNADDRTNQIIVISDARLHPFFDKLIARLDVRSDPNTRNEIIYLKHAEATEVASLVSNLVSGQNQATSRSESAPRRNGNTVQPATLQPAAPSNAAAAAAGANSSEFSQLVTILPDERSNAVVVSGTVEDIRLIKELIDKIDVLLAQVRIEVVIAEVTLKDDAASGIDQLGLLVDNGKLVGFTADAAGLEVGGTGFAPLDPTNIEAIASETFAIAPNYDLTGLIGVGTNPRKSDAQLLQVPAVVTTHNKEAEFFVGQDIPVLGSFIPDAGGTTGNNLTSTAYRTTVNNRQVGIRLLVKPLIGNNGSVQMEIEQIVEDVIGDTTIDGNTQPIVGQREMKSFVSVQDGEIIVMGGMQRGIDRKTTSRLGPIPFIGDLLGLRTRSNEKTDLIFFLRPTILNPGAMGTDEAMERVDRMPNAEEVHRVLDQEPLIKGK